MTAGPYVKNSLDLMEKGPSVAIPLRVPPKAARFGFSSNVQE